MLIDLHSVSVSLSSSSEQISEIWRNYFDLELASAFTQKSNTEPDIILEATVRSVLPQVPTASPSYASLDPPLVVYSDSNQKLILRLADAVHIELQVPATPNSIESKTVLAQISVTDYSLESGHLEAMTSLALAPLLRRRGLFLIHAFAAAFEEQAVLFVGPSGSGKTSSGLASVAGGWDFLANDMALVQQSSKPKALLSPGTIQVAPFTFSLLPEYAGLSTKYRKISRQTKFSIPRMEIIHDHNPRCSAPITTVFFPVVSMAEKHSINTVPRAVGLARLMASSMDQWDRGIWDAHISFLERLSHRIQFFDLQLGRNMVELPECLEKMILGK